MGGRNLDSLEFEVLLREGDEDEDWRQVEDALDNFDAERCSCFQAEDKARMLEVVWAAFGTTSAFNTAVRDMFRHTRLRDTLSSNTVTSQRSQPRHPGGTLIEKVKAFLCGARWSKALALVWRTGVQ